MLEEFHRQRNLRAIALEYDFYVNLVVRPVAGPERLRLLAQCWKRKLFAKSVLSINDSLVSRVVVEIAYPRKISRLERDYHQQPESLMPMPCTRKLTLV